MVPASAANHGPILAAGALQVLPAASPRRALGSVFLPLSRAARAGAGALELTGGAGHRGCWSLALRWQASSLGCPSSRGCTGGGACAVLSPGSTSRSRRCCRPCPRNCVTGVAGKPAAWQVSWWTWQGSGLINASRRTQRSRTPRCRRARHSAASGHKEQPASSRAALSAQQPPTSRLS